jgi:hypothetical protein
MVHAIVGICAPHTHRWALTAFQGARAIRAGPREHSARVKRAPKAGSQVGRWVNPLAARLSIVVSGELARLTPVVSRSPGQARRAADAGSHVDRRVKPNGGPVERYRDRKVRAVDADCLWTIGSSPMAVRLSVVVIGKFARATPVPVSIIGSSPMTVVRWRVAVTGNVRRAVATSLATSSGGASAAGRAHPSCATAASPGPSWPRSRAD